jgi:hypothetical protein
MLWMIWIVLMLLVPAVAGVQVWWQMRRAPVEVAPVECSSGSGEALLNQES